MNGLPVDVDLSPLHGIALEQVRIARHQLQLVFGEKCTVVAEGKCVLRDGRSRPIVVEDYAGSATAICSLLGRRVERATRTTTGGLLIALGSDSGIEFLVDRQEFESFQLHVGGSTYVA